MTYLVSGQRPAINHLMLVREVNCSTKHHDEVMSVKELEHICECFEVCSNLNSSNQHARVHKS